MPVSFSRTLRSLRNDRQPWGFAGVLMLLLMPITAAWLFGSQVSVYEVSSSARIEVLKTPQTVTAEVEGRVVESILRVGLVTRPGDIVVRLYAESVRREMDEVEQQITSSNARLAEFQRQIEANQQSLATLIKARQMSVQEKQQQLIAAQARSRSAELIFQRASKLATNNAGSADEVDRARAELETATALVQAAQYTVELGELDRLALEKQQEAEHASIRGDAEDTAGTIAKHIKTLRRLELDLQQRSIQAHVAGRVEDVAPFRLGSVVRPSEKLATIVPPGQNRVVAMLPVIAVGRVLEGQSAKLRLDGFPWTQYGSIAATVSAVGNEPTDGLIRVELEIDADPPSSITLQHGQTGSVEIEVERVSPALLILRAAGERLMTERSPTSAP